MSRRQNGRDPSNFIPWRRARLWFETSRHALAGSLSDFGSCGSSSKSNSSLGEAYVPSRLEERSASLFSSGRRSSSGLGSVRPIPSNRARLSFAFTTRGQSRVGNSHFGGRGSGTKAQSSSGTWIFTSCPGLSGLNSLGSIVEPIITQTVLLKFVAQYFNIVEHIKTFIKRETLISNPAHGDFIPHDAKRRFIASTPRQDVFIHVQC